MTNEPHPNETGGGEKATKKQAKKQVQDERIIISVKSTLSNESNSKKVWMASLSADIQNDFEYTSWNSKLMAILVLQENLSKCNDSSLCDCADYGTAQVSLVKVVFIHPNSDQSCLPQS